MTTEEINLRGWGFENAVAAAGFLTQKDSRCACNQPENLNLFSIAPRFVVLLGTQNLPTPSPRPGGVYNSSTIYGQPALWVDLVTR